MMGQEDGQRVSNDTQLTTTLGAVETHHEVGEETGTQHTDSEVARDLSFLPLGVVWPNVVTRRAVLQQTRHQQ